MVSLSPKSMFKVAGRGSANGGNYRKHPLNNLGTPEHCIGGKGVGCGAKCVANASDISSVYCPGTEVVPP